MGAYNHIWNYPMPRPWMEAAAEAAESERVELAAAATHELEV